MILDPQDAMLLTFEASLREVIEDLALGPDGDMPVNFYGYKDLSETMELPQIVRPAVMVQPIQRADRDVPSIGGKHYPYIGSVGVAVYIETPISVKAVTSGEVILGGYDTLMQPICSAFLQWFNDNPALDVPDDFRLDPADTANPVMFGPESIDMRRSSVFRVQLRPQEFLRTVYYPILDAVQAT